MCTVRARPHTTVRWLQHCKMHATATMATVWLLTKGRVAGKAEMRKQPCRLPAAAPPRAPMRHGCAPPVASALPLTAKDGRGKSPLLCVDDDVPCRCRVPVFDASSTRDREGEHQPFCFSMLVMAHHIWAMAACGSWRGTISITMEHTSFRSGYRRRSAWCGAIQCRSRHAQTLTPHLSTTSRRLLTSGHVTRRAVRA